MKKSKRDWSKMTLQEQIKQTEELTIYLTQKENGGGIYEFNGFDNNNQYKVLQIDTNDQEIRVNG